MAQENLSAKERDLVVSYLKGTGMWDDNYGFEYNIGQWERSERTSLKGLEEDGVLNKIEKKQILAEANAWKKEENKKIAEQKRRDKQESDIWSESDGEEVRNADAGKNRDANLEVNETMTSKEDDSTRLEKREAQNRNASSSEKSNLPDRMQSQLTNLGVPQSLWNDPEVITAVTRISTNEPLISTVYIQNDSKTMGVLAASSLKAYEVLEKHGVRSEKIDHGKSELNKQVEELQNRGVLNKYFFDPIGQYMSSGEKDYKEALEKAENYVAAKEATWFDSSQLTDAQRQAADAAGLPIIRGGSPYINTDEAKRKFKDLMDNGVTTIDVRVTTENGEKIPAGTKLSDEKYKLKNGNTLAVEKYNEFSKQVDDYAKTVRDEYNQVVQVASNPNIPLEQRRAFVQDYLNNNTNMNNFNSLLKDNYAAHNSGIYKFENSTDLSPLLDKGPVKKVTELAQEQSSTKQVAGNDPKYANMQDEINAVRANYNNAGQNAAVGGGKFRGNDNNLSV